MRTALVTSLCLGSAALFTVDETREPPAPPAKKPIPAAPKDAIVKRASPVGQQSAPASDSTVEPRPVRAAPVRVGIDVEAALDMPVRAEFNDTPLSQVLSFLGTQSGIRVHLDDRGVTDAMIDRDNPVTFNQEGVRLGLVLDLILEPRGLDYAVRENILFVSSRDRIIEMRETAVIRLGDVLPPGEAADESAERLIGLITENIDRGDWTANGGVSCITFVPDARSLVVTASSRTHRKISKLLNELRSAKVAQGLPPATTVPIAAR